jgi:hypothetical protein
MLARLRVARTMNRAPNVSGRRAPSLSVSRPVNGDIRAPSTAPTLVTAEICVLVQPNSAVKGTMKTVRTPMAVALLTKLIPDTAAKTYQP